MTKNQRTNLFSLLYLSVVAQAMRRNSLQPRALLHSSPERAFVIRHACHSSSFMTIRGGSTTAEESEEAEFSAPQYGKTDQDKNQREEDEEEDEEEKRENPAEIPKEPAKFLVQTNLGCTVLDHRLELMASRTKTIADLKKSISRKLPGKMPLLGLELVFEGKILEDEMLIDELFEDLDGEDEDEDEGESKYKVLTLNIIPTVERKFATELAPKLKSHIEDDEDTLTTEEILEAYFLNQAAMLHNTQLLANPSMHSSPTLRLDLQQEAQKLKEQLRSQIPDDIWARSLEATKRDLHTEEIKGQRYRSGKGGAKTSLKKTIQTNLNIDWFETTWNFLLLLFFGHFGGRNSLSRYLMLWGAPLVFILQARPVKLWLKILFYMMANPPAIISSLLPAPEQAILNADLEKSYEILYNPNEAAKRMASNTAKGRFLVGDTKRAMETAIGEKKEDAVEIDDDEEEELDEASDDSVEEIDDNNDEEG